MMKRLLILTLFVFILSVPLTLSLDGFGLDNPDISRLNPSDVLTRTIGDSIYCMIGGNCILNNLTITNYINLTIAEIHINATLVGGENWVNETGDIMTGNLTLNQDVNGNPALIFKEGALDVGWDIRSQFYLENHLLFDTFKDGVYTTRMSIRRRLAEIEMYANLSMNDHDIDDLRCIDFTDGTQQCSATNATFNSTWISGEFVPYTGAIKNVDLGANNLTVDTTTFHVDSLNERVGIGTVNPSDMLELVGSTVRVRLDSAAHASITIDRGAATRNGYIVYSTAGGTNWIVGVTDSDLIGDGTEYWIGTATNSAALLIKTNGNVGIGTTSPEYKLDVYGTIRANKTNVSRYYDSSLVGSYLFNDNADDSSQYRNDGNFRGGASVSRNVAEFDGNGDYIENDNFVGLAIGLGLSISIWYYPISYGTTDRYLINIGGGTYIRLDDTVARRITIKLYNSTESAVSESLNNCYTLNEWNHVAVTYDKSEIKYYCNGVKTGNTDEMAGGIKAYNGSNVRISYSLTGAFNGSIDTVKIYNRALTNEEIQRLYAEENKDNIHVNNLYADNILIEGDLNITGEILGSEDHYTAYSNSTIAIANGVYTIIDYNKLMGSSGIIKDGKNFTVPADGDYDIHVDFQCDKTGGGTENVEAIIFKNNIQVNGTARHRTINSNNEIGYFAINTELYLLQGDNITIGITSDGGDTELRMACILCQDPVSTSLTIERTR